MISIYVTYIMVMECTVQYREMCFGIRICNECHGEGVYNTIERNVLSSVQKLPYSCLYFIDQTEFAIQLSVLCRPNRSHHTAVCAVQTKQK